MKNSVERRSEVFVSATSRDLGAVREMAAKGLMTIGCHPVAQDTFPPDYRQVEDMLRDKIAACDAVVHIVGMRYGEEPPPGSLPEGTPRRSYTQMEADLARQLDKKLYVFVCPEDFPYDAAHAEEPETEDKQALQRAYREQLLTENTHLRTDVRDAADLGQRIRELDVELARLRGAVGRDRRRFVQVMALLAVVLVALAGGVWWSIAGRPTKEEIAAEVYKANPDLIKEQMRRTIRDSAEAKIKQFKDDGKGWQDIQQVEKERDLQLDEVDRMVERIVEGAKNAHPMYTRALEILEKEGPDALLAYLGSQENTLEGLIEKQKERKKLVEEREAAELHQLLRVRLLEASNLETQLRYDDAIAAYRKVLDADPDWIEPYPDFTWLLMSRGEVIDPTQGNKMIEEAETLCRNGLARMTAERTPLWANVQLALASVLQCQGERLEGDAGVQKLEEAVTACRAALEVYTRAALPQQWATTQNNLAGALLRQGERLEGEAGVQKLEEAVTACRAALEVRTRAALPQDWAMTQNNLAVALQAQGERLAGDAAVQKLEEAVTAYRAALEVRTRAALPQDWAGTQNNLAIALWNQGARLEGEAAVQKLEEAVTAYRAALEVYTRAALPQNWATTQNNLAVALWNQGARLEGEAGVQKLDEAVTALRAALEVRTRAALPQDWATTQNNLANALSSQGERLEGDAGVQKLEEAVTAYRAALEVYTREALPQQWAATQNNLALAYSAWASKFVDMKKYKDAVKSYQGALACHRALAAAALNKQNWDAAQAGDLVSIAWRQLFLKQYQAALEASEQALQLDASQTAIHTNRAHALLFLNRFDEAKAVYLKYAKEDLGDGKTFAQAVLVDFDALEEAGVTHPGMEKIRKLLKDE